MKMEMEMKLLYLGILVVLSILLYKLVGLLSFHGIDGFNPVCMLLSIIASHLITVRLLDKEK